MANSDSINDSSPASVGPVLARTLCGEYLAMLLVVHAGVTVLFWGPAIGMMPSTAGIAVVSSGWVIIRALGRGAGQILSLIITLPLILTTALCIAYDGVVGIGFDVMSFPLLLVMLATILTVDLTELHERYFSSQESRHKLRSFLYRYGLPCLGWGVAGFLVIYGFVIPLIQEWQFQRQPLPEDPRHALERLTLQENTLFKLCEGAMALFCFVIGTCVGSFLNVVIYRVPLRISVLVKPSHCPGCSERIHGKDNIPILGWLKLQGCCRNCGTAISARYPVVELVVGLLFLALFFVELISGGVNLPGRAPNPYAGVLWILFYTKWDLVGLYLYHCLLICTVFSWAMIRRDGHQVPLISVLLMVAMVIVPLFPAPHLQPLSGFALSHVGLRTALDLNHTLATTGLGFGAGLGAVLLIRLFRFWSGRRLLSDDVPSWLLVGIVLGWQAVIGVFLLSLLWQLLSRVRGAVFGIARSDAAQLNQYLVLPWILSVHHCLWRPLMEFICRS